MEKIEFYLNESKEIEEFYDPNINLPPEEVINLENEIIEFMDDLDAMFRTSRRVPNLKYKFEPELFLLWRSMK